MKTETEVHHNVNVAILTLLAIILVEGFVTISLEILTIRQLTPFVGSSVIVTSLIIGVFLLFLAIGYWRGGQYTQEYSKVLKGNFVKAAILMGLGLSYWFCSLWFYVFEGLLLSNLLTGLVFYLLVITAPAVYWLGQTVPITTNLFRKETTIGAISGKVLFLSTVGSFLGAVLTSLLLFAFLGVAWTVVINFFCLFFLVYLVSDWHKDMYLHLVYLGLAGVMVFYINVQVGKMFFVHTNNYANYRVEPMQVMQDGRTGTAFIINDSLSSFLDKDRKGAQYIERIKQFLFIDLGLKNQKILVVGAGGFTLSAESDFGNEFTYLDIDPGIEKLAKQHFVGEIRGKFIAADARVFLRTSKESYDVILNDVYSNKNSIPAHLMTKEYITDLRARLKPGGIAIFNMIASATLDDAYSVRMDNTISSVFRNCVKTPLHYVDRLTNFLYFCKTSPLESDHVVYEDNLNPVTIDYFNAMQKANAKVRTQNERKKI